MTGTGTSSDPYIVSTWEEFCAAMDESGVYISIPEGTVWDFNDIMPEGASFSFSGSGNVVRGNGAVFRNLYIKQGALISHNAHITFHNVGFTNIYASGGTFATGGSFKNCRFSGKFYGDSVFAGNGNVLSATCGFGVSDGKGCAFNLGFYNNAKFNSSVYSPEFTSPNIMLSGDSGANSAAITVYDGLIQGVLPSESMSFNAKRCIFDISVSGSITNTGSTQNAPSVINTDKVSGTYTGFLEANSSTIRSTAYLASIGFPIGDDS